MKCRALISMLVFLLFTLILHADLESHMSQLSGAVAEAHLKPVASVLGAQANGGWFINPPADTLFNFKISVNWIGTYAGYNHTKDRKFSVQGPVRFNYEQADQIVPVEIEGVQREAIITALLQNDFQVYAYGPTLLGFEYSLPVLFIDGHPGITINFPGQTIQYILDGNPMEIIFPNTTLKTLIGGYEKDNWPYHSTFIMPLQMKQITLGTIAGTQLILRGGNHPLYKIGSAKTTGIGIQHNLMFWFPEKIPIDISILGGYQTVELGKIARNINSIYGVVASIKKTTHHGSLTFFTELTNEQSTTKIKYDFPYSISSSGKLISHREEFTLKGRNSVRATFGGDWIFGILDLRAEGHLANNSGISISVGLLKEF